MADSGKSGRAGGWNPIRVLNTSRPFTPLDNSRSGRRLRQGAGGDLPRLVIQESREELAEDDVDQQHSRQSSGGSIGRSSLRTAEIRLPSIRGQQQLQQQHQQHIHSGSGGGKGGTWEKKETGIVRKQFRPATSSSSAAPSCPAEELYPDEDSSLGSNGQCRTDKNGGDSIEDMSPQEGCQHLLNLLLVRPEQDGVPDGNNGPGEHAIKSAEALLARQKRKRQRLPRECFLPLSKMMFLLASDDDNDRLFCCSSLPGDLVEQALGEMDVAGDAEAVLNCYGALKLLSHNPELLERLCSHGLVPLLVLHLKVLAGLGEDGRQGKVKLGKNVTFQATACLRNCLNSQRGQAEFVSGCGGLAVLDAVAERFSGSREISCNLARLYSVLSQLGEAQQQRDLSSSVRALHRLTSLHPSCSELVVRTAFALGNVAAQGDSGRSALLAENGLLECLAEMMDERTKKIASSSSSGRKLDEDILVKTIRVFANLAVLPEGGHWAATNDRLVRCLVTLLERKADEQQQGEGGGDPHYLLLSALSAVCNLSYYPIVRHCDLYDGVLDHVHSADLGVAAEAARAVGNLSRMKPVRARLGESENMARLMEVVDRQADQENPMARDLRFALVGTFVNSVADPQLKDNFLSLGGLGLGLKWLLETRFVPEDGGGGTPHNSAAADWPMATLLCQLLWNTLTSLSERWKAAVRPEMGELEEILEEMICLEGEENGKELRRLEDASEFAAVAFQLMEKASVIANDVREK